MLETFQARSAAGRTRIVPPATRFSSNDGVSVSNRTSCKRAGVPPVNLPSPGSGTGLFGNREWDCHCVLPSRRHRHSGQAEREPESSSFFLDGNDSRVGLPPTVITLIKLNLTLILLSYTFNPHAGRFNLVVCGTGGRRSTVRQ